MTCMRLGPGLGNGIICIEPDYRMKDRTGKVWYFEYHKYCGPSVLRRDRELSKRQPAEKFFQRAHGRERSGEEQAIAGLRDGEGLPRFVEQEFRDFLRCGCLAGG
jgi:hypothetical protein